MMMQRAGTPADRREFTKCLFLNRLAGAVAGGL
jgi:hypothetical protein